MDEVKRRIHIVNNNLDKNVRINQLEIQGIKWTNSSLIEKEIQPALKASTFGEIIQELNQACHRLSHLGIFKEMDVVIDTSPEYRDKYNEVDVTIIVKEKPRLFLKTGTEIGSDEGSLNLSANLRNVFGSAETVECSFARGTRTNASFRMCFTKPINANPNNTVEISAFQNEQDWLESSSFVLGQRGLEGKLKTLSRFGLHEVTMDYVIREVGKISPKASLEFVSWILNEAGMTVKASLSHVLNRDLRDDAFFPRKGSLLKIRTEIANINCETNFLKNELEAQKCYPLPFGLSTSATLRCGFLYTLNGQSSNIIDRFFIGGPWSVRGFRTHGIGPTSSSPLKPDFLGGDAYWTGGLSLFMPIPFLGKYQWLRGQAFLNSGSLVAINSAYSFGSYTDQIRSKLSNSPTASSTGLGLLLRTHFCRFELNYVHPISFTNVDNRSPKFQIGIGVHFL